MLAACLGRFFPGDRRSVRRGSKQLLRDGLAPFCEQRPAFIRIVRGMVIAFGQAVRLSARNRALHFHPHFPVLPERIGLAPCVFPRVPQMPVSRGEGFAFIAIRLHLLDLDAGDAAEDASPCEWLAALGEKAGGFGEVDDVAHDCTAFPASIAAAMVALSW